MKFNQILYNSFDEPSELCKIGFKYKTDKTSLTDVKNSHSYTSFYNFLFSQIRNKKIVFGEIGIYQNASMKMWKEYFPNVELYGWDCKVEENMQERYRMDFIESARQENLPNVIYDYMNVRDEFSIIESMKKTEKKFDVIIDDSDHEFWSQIRLIRSLPQFIKEGGFLIIEDVGTKIYEYFESIQEFGHDVFYDSLIQVKTTSSSQKYGSDCDEIIVLIRNGVKNAF